MLKSVCCNLQQFVARSYILPVYYVMLQFIGIYNFQDLLHVWLQMNLHKLRSLLYSTVVVPEDSKQ